MKKFYEIHQEASEKFRRFGEIDGFSDYLYTTEEEAQAIKTRYENHLTWRERERKDVILREVGTEEDLRKEFEDAYFEEDEINEMIAKIKNEGSLYGQYW